MEITVTCSKDEKCYIDARMTAVENIMSNPSNYENAQKDVVDTIDGLCKELPQCCIYIQEKYGKLCAKYGLDWYTDWTKDNAVI